MSATLRPGRFLGNHYIAFTVPERSAIVTMDRLKEGMRVARRNKREADEALKATQEAAVASIILDEDGEPNNVHNDGNTNTQLLNGQIVERGNDLFSFLEKEGSKTQNNTPNLVVQGPEGNKGFFNRFVQGYITATVSHKGAEERAARLSSAISDWFGQQKVVNDEETQ